jgi:hypothetical protein
LRKRENKKKSVKDALTGQTVGKDVHEEAVEQQAQGQEWVDTGQPAKHSLPELVPPGTPQEPAGDVAVTGPLQREDRMALALRLTAEIKQDLRSAIRKLGQVHRERLWEEMGYQSFGEYVLLEFGKTPKWGYQRLTLHKAVEWLEAQGVTDPLLHLSPEAALVFRKWENSPEVFFLAYQQVLESGDRPTQDRLTEECEVQNDYLREASFTPDLTQEEYRAYRRLNGLPYTFQLDREFQSADDLLEECRTLKKKPPLKAITRVARGDNLVGLVQQLEPLGAEVVRLKELKQKKEDLEKQRRDHVKDLNEELRQVEAEIADAEGSEDEGEGGDEDVAPTADATSTDSAETGTPAAPPRLPEPHLADLEADPRAFVEDTAVRLELTANHADLLRGIKDDVAILLTRITKAMVSIRALVEPVTVRPEDGDDGRYEPEEVPQDGTLLDE